MLRLDLNDAASASVAPLPPLPDFGSDGSRFNIFGANFNTFMAGDGQPLGADGGGGGRRTPPVLISSNMTVYALDATSFKVIAKRDFGEYRRCCVGQWRYGQDGGGIVLDDGQHAVLFGAAANNGYQTSADAYHVKFDRYTLEPVATSKVLAQAARCAVLTSPRATSYVAGTTVSSSFSRSLGLSTVYDI